MNDNTRFKDTENKRALRKFDKKIIENYCSVQKIKKLSYFGLPGEKMLDILEWKEYLNTWVAVEIDDETYTSLIFTALEKNLSRGLTPIKGDIDEVLIGNINDTVKFPFDLFNLDYSGGAIYKNKEGEAKRPEGWKSLFRRQKEEHKHDFLLFLSLNSREKDEGEITNVLNEMQRKLDGEKKSELSSTIKKTVEKGGEKGAI